MKKTNFYCNEGLHDRQSNHAIFEASPSGSSSPSSLEQLDPLSESLCAEGSGAAPAGCAGGDSSIEEADLQLLEGEPAAVALGRAPACV